MRGEESDIVEPGWPGQRLRYRWKLRSQGVFEIVARAIYRLCILVSNDRDGRNHPIVVRHPAKYASGDPSAYPEQAQRRIRGDPTAIDLNLQPGVIVVLVAEEVAFRLFRAARTLLTRRLDV